MARPISAFTEISSNNISDTDYTLLSKPGVKTYKLSMSNLKEFIGTPANNILTLSPINKTVSGKNVTLAFGYNSTNLMLDANNNLTTVQNISTGSSPTFDMINTFEVRLGYGNNSYNRLYMSYNNSVNDYVLKTEKPLEIRNGIIFRKYGTWEYVALYIERVDEQLIRFHLSGYNMNSDIDINRVYFNRNENAGSSYIESGIIYTPSRQFKLGLAGRIYSFAESTPENSSLTTIALKDYYDGLAHISVHGILTNHIYSFNNSIRIVTQVNVNGYYGIEVAKFYYSPHSHIAQFNAVCGTILAGDTLLTNNGTLLYSSTDYLNYLFDTTGNNITVYLPNENNFLPSAEFLYKKIDNTQNIVTITSENNKTIEGNTTYVLRDYGEYVKLMYFNGQWYITSRDNSVLLE